MNKSITTNFFLCIIVLPVFFCGLLKFGYSQQSFFKSVLQSSDVNQQQFNCFYQDSRGFIYLGTDQGVYTFDGTLLEQLSIPDTLSDYGVSCIFEDSRNYLWFGFNNGTILRFNGFDNYERILIDHNINTRITSIVEDLNQQIWIGTYGNGLFNNTEDSILNYNSESGLSDDYIYTLILSTDGELWLGTDNGINTFDLNNSNPTINVISINDGLPDFIVQSLVEDEHGNIWIGLHDGGVCYYNPFEESFHLPDVFQNWSYGPVNSLALFDDRIWIGTQGNGIIEYLFESKLIRRYKEYQNCDFSRVTNFYQDNEGNIWIITNDEICLSFGGQIEFLQSIQEKSIKNVHAMAIDQEDILWFANDNGLYSYDMAELDENKKLINHSIGIQLGAQKIMSLYCDSFGNIWIGTFGQGIVRFNPKTGQQVLLNENDGLINGNVLSITGNKDEIWFGTLGGASRVLVNEQLKNIYYKPHFENHGSKEGLSNHYIYQVHLAKNGIPYFATDGNGVLTYKEGKFEKLTEEDGISEKVIYSVTTDDYGNTWMNAAVNGLYKFDGQKLTKVTDDPEHRNLSFSGILSLSNELVIIYDEGIDVLDINTHTIKHLESNAGLENINPDLNTIALDSKNNFWVGTSMGIIKYRYQGEVRQNHPKTELSAVSMFLSDFDFKRKNKFDFNENHFSFSYAGLWYQYPEKVEYLIKLEGHDLDWIKTKNKHVIYSNLKPGKYTFKVIAGIYDNYKNTEPAIYSFEIKKPIWLNLWFIVLIILIAGATIWILIQRRVNRLRKEQALIHEKIKFQFENLRSQINPHFLFNSFSTLIALIETNSKDAVDYVEELSNLFRSVLEYKDQDLIPLITELEVVDNYIKLQKKRFGNNLHVDLQKKEFSPDLMIPPLTLQLLIENAIKHNIVSRENPLKIQIYGDPEKACIFVKNDIQLKEKGTVSTGIGINNIISRYRILSEKNIEIRSSENKFIVGLPFIKNTT